MGQRGPGTSGAEGVMHAGHVCDTHLQALPAVALPPQRPPPPLRTGLSAGTAHGGTLAQCRRAIQGGWLTAGTAHGGQPASPLGTLPGLALDTNSSRELTTQAQHMGSPAPSI